MASDTSLLFSIVGRDKTKAAFSSAAGGAKKLGGSMKAALGGIGAAVAGVGIAQLGMDMVNVASDIAESTSKVETLFGKFSDSATDAAEKSAAAMGISKAEYLAAVGNIGAVDRAMGTNQKEASKLANEYVKLSADLGSFNNASSAEVQEALTASIAGEYEQLKKYGIVVNDNTLATEAARIGMKKSGATWDSAQKRQLSYNIIMKSTKAAQGDFARTSGGLANQTKILKAKFTDLKGTLGAKLLPVAVKVAGVLVKLVDNSKNLAKWLAPVGRMVKVFFNALRGNSEMNEFSGGLQKANNVGMRLGMWIRDDFIPTAKALARWFIDEGIPAIKNFAKQVWTNAQPVIQMLARTFREDIVPAVQKLIQRFREAWPTIHRVIVLAKQLSSIIAKYVLPVIAKLAGEVLGRLIRVLGWVFTKVVQVIGIAVKLGTAIFNAGKSFGLFAFAAKEKIGQAYGWVKDKIGAMVGFFKGLPGKIGNATRGMFDGIRDAFKAAINWIIGKWNGLEFSLPSVSAFGKTIGGATIGVPDLPMLAKGGTVRGAGSVMVGERGPEVLSLPRGARVDPLPRGGSGNGGGEQVINLTVNQYDEKGRLREQMKEVVRIYGGGNVQAAIGRA